MSIVFCVTHNGNGNQKTQVKTHISCFKTSVHCTYLNFLNTSCHVTSEHNYLEKKRLIGYTPIYFISQLYLTEWIKEMKDRNFYNFK